MPLNMLKLCVGAESVEDLEAYVALRYKMKGGRLIDDLPFHTTRMVPKRADELLDGGSLYWVIKGSIQCRQQFRGIKPFRDSEGIGRCDLLLDPKIVRTEWAPRRAFQGWRYLTKEDAPADIGAGDAKAAMPADLRRELAELGLL